MYEYYFDSFDVDDVALQLLYINWPLLSVHGIELIIYIVISGFTIFRYSQTKSKGQILFLIPLILQCIQTSLAFVDFIAILISSGIHHCPSCWLFLLITASNVFLLILQTIYLHRARSMEERIGKKKAMVLQYMFYTWMGALFISAVLSIATVALRVGQSSIYSTMYIMGITAYAINLTAAIFGFVITIWYILVIPKNSPNQAIRLMCLYGILCLCFAVIFLGLAIFISFGLVVFYLITLAPRNAMQNYDVPIEMNATIQPAQHPQVTAPPGMVPVIVYVPASPMPTTNVMYTVPGQPMPMPTPTTIPTHNVTTTRDEELQNVTIAQQVN
ncbi:hypothetical protein BDF19DRAFT_410776 [Syncephalis fuscata]|nr:hypothetical protein BDF19DRAFT_410776 [Syncephalis fuscata]